MGFYRVYWVYWVSLRFRLSFHHRSDALGTYRVIGFSGFYWVELRFQEVYMFYRVYWVSLRLDWLFRNRIGMFL